MLELINQGFYDILENLDGSFDATKDGIRYKRIKPSQQKYIIDYAEAIG